MDWDYLEVLKFTALSIEAVTAAFMGIFALIALTWFAAAFLNPVWRSKRRRIEQRTDLSGDTLDALFRGARHPLHRLFSSLCGVCLLVVGLGFLAAIAGFAIAATTQSTSAGALFLVSLLLAVMSLLLSVILVGAWHLFLARAVLMEDRIDRLADLDGGIFEHAKHPVGKSEVRYYRLRGLMVLTVSSLIGYAFLPKLTELLLSSLELMLRSN